MIQKKTQDRECSQEDSRPVIRRVGNGEQIAGFMDQRNRFTEVMKIRNSRDMDEFLETYNVSVAEITKASENAETGEVLDNGRKK